MELCSIGGPGGRGRGDGAPAAGDAVPLLGQRITQGVVGFVRLFAVLNRLVDGVDLLLHHRQDLLRFLP